MKWHTHPDDILLQAYLDGETNTTDREDIAQHLTICESCTIRLSEMRNLSHLLEEVEEVSLDRDLSTAVLSTLHTKARNRTRTNWMLLGQLCLTTLIIILLIPVISTYLLQANAAENINKLIEYSTDAIQQLANQWHLIRTTILASISRYTNIRSFGTYFTWPPSGGWMWILPGSLLWLIINGLLLIQNGYMNKSTVRKSQ